MVHFDIILDCFFNNLVTKGGYTCITGYKKNANSITNKIFVFNSSIELVAKSEIEVEGDITTAYYFSIVKMDIAVGGKPIIIVGSEGSFRNLYAFAFEGNRVFLVDKIEDIHQAKILDLKYYNGHYFTYGLDGVINRVSLSQ